MVFQLNEKYLFPHPDWADNDGLLAVGGDLHAGRLLMAYCNGIFPWYEDDLPILWYAPKERFVLFPENLKISDSLRQTIRSGRFRVTYDLCFEEVIRNCAGISRKEQDGTWITTEMQEAYINLHNLGYAHSVEVWRENTLVGGLYGVGIGNVFCGESMFSKQSNASKVALVYLCGMKSWSMIDCQIPSEHLERMGAALIPADYFRKLLKKAKANEGV